jgi:hypothetical protein
MNESTEIPHLLYLKGDVKKTNIKIPRNSPSLNESVKVFKNGKPIDFTVNKRGIKLKKPLGKKSTIVVFYSAPS